MLADAAEPDGMRYESLEMQNFRGLGEISVPLHRFTCIIGENNAGKSSVLHALHAVMPVGSYKLTPLDFGDPSRPIRIALRIEGIGRADLERVSSKHQQSIANDLVDGGLTLVRSGELADNKVTSRLEVVRRRPIEQRWRTDFVKDRLKGSTGPAFRQTVLETWPEFAENASTLTTQKAVIAAVEAYTATLLPDEFELYDAPVGTGIDQGYAGLLPEVIYVASVKDVSDEVKTTDSAVFGKLISLLMESVRDDLGPLDNHFQQVQKQLSRVVGNDGESIVDVRHPAVQEMEARLTRFTQEAFPGVELQIEVPVPQLKTIFSSAAVLVDDGHTGPIASKGDGLKRAFIFALLRTLMEQRASNKSTDTVRSAGYWLLFEEPELFLYPHAQRQIFRALEAFAISNQVLVTTHSPAFLEASNRGRAFVKLSKVLDAAGKPHGAKVNPVSLADEKDRDAFQLICHENNSAGFFATKVVLVEGDSDAVVFPHLARLLGGNAWNIIERNVTFARIDGKGNIERYRRFFDKFGVDVHVIVDLDVLARGFDKLGVNSESKDLYSQLQQKVLTRVSASEPTALNNQQAKALAESRDFKSLWAGVTDRGKAMGEGGAGWEDLNQAVAEFFAHAHRQDLMTVYRDPGTDLSADKEKLLKLLAEQRIHVLARGTVEDYYAAGKNTKVEHAVRFESECLTVDDLRGRLGQDYEAIESELRNIFTAILGPAGS
jgi:predicted ATP-dependent endonuclease of OLD family